MRSSHATDLENLLLLVLFDLDCRKPMIVYVLFLLDLAPAPAGFEDVSAAPARLVNEIHYMPSYSAKLNSLMH